MARPYRVRCSSPLVERSSGAGMLRGGQHSPTSSGEAREVLLGCWLAPIIQRDGGDACMLTQQGV